MNPIVINSKKAQNHLNDIKSQHADLVQGIQDQSLRVAQLNTEKEAQKQIVDTQKSTDTMNTNKMELDNKKLMMDAETKRLAEQNKAKELEIKSKALTME